MKKLLAIFALSAVLLAFPAVAFASATSFGPAGSSCTMAQEAACPMYENGGCAMDGAPCATQGTCCGGCASQAHRIACPRAFGRPALMGALDCINLIQAKLVQAATAATEEKAAAEIQPQQAPEATAEPETAQENAAGNEASESNAPRSNAKPSKKAPAAAEKNGPSKKNAQRGGNYADADGNGGGHHGQGGNYADAYGNGACDNYENGTCPTPGRGNGGGHHGQGHGCNR